MKTKVISLYEETPKQFLNLTLSQKIVNWINEPLSDLFNQCLDMTDLHAIYDLWMVLKTFLVIQMFPIFSHDVAGIPISA